MNVYEVKGQFLGMCDLQRSQQLCIRSEVGISLCPKLTFFFFLNQVKEPMTYPLLTMVFGLPIVSGHCSNTDYWKADRASTYLRAGALDFGLRPI